MSAHDARLEVLQRPKILDDIAAGVVEEQFSVLRPADRDYPFELIAILEQIIDGLSYAASRDDGDLWARRLFLFLLGHRFADPLPDGERSRTDNLH